MGKGARINKHFLVPSLRKFNHVKKCVVCEKMLYKQNKTRLCSSCLTIERGKGHYYSKKQNEKTKYTK